METVEWEDASSEGTTREEATTQQGLGHAALQHVNYHLVRCHKTKMGLL